MPPGEGYNRDHPIINVSGPQAVDISKMEFPATIVVVGGFDLLRDWQKRYYEWLKRSGKDAYLVEYPNMCHGFYAFPELPESEQLISEVKDFIHKKNIHLLWRRTTNPACRMMCDRVNKYQHKYDKAKSNKEPVNEEFYLILLLIHHQHHLCNHRQEI